MSDETTEPVRVVCPHSYTAACRECLPLPATARLKAENARLRERVAELDVMLGQACEAVNWLLDQDWPKDMDPGPGIRTDLAKWLAALAQAGEGGAA